MTCSPPPPSCPRTLYSIECQRSGAVLEIKLTTSSRDNTINEDPEMSSAHQSKDDFTSDSEDEEEPPVSSDDLESGIAWAEMREEATAQPVPRRSDTPNRARGQEWTVEEIMLIPTTLVVAFIIMEVHGYMEYNATETFCRHPVLMGLSEIVCIGTCMTGFVGCIIWIHRSYMHESAMKRAGFAVFVWGFVCLLTAGVLGLGLLGSRPLQSCERAMENHGES